jgi:thiamine-monophosphate kinase
VPRGITVDFLDRFIDGMLALASEFGVTLIGGDTCRSRSGLVISVTVMGEQFPERVIRRTGARPGDRVFVTGTVGDAALGLALLRRGEREGWAVSRHRDPSPRVAAGLALAETGIATAMIDVSDGVAADLGHVLACSGVGACIDAGALPLSPFFRERSPALGEDPALLALTGGEDYELLFTVPPDRTAEVVPLLEGMALAATPVGEVIAGSGLTVLQDGRPLSLARRGFNHFVDAD